MTGCSTRANQVPPRGGGATDWRLDRQGQPQIWCESYRQSPRTSTIATGTVTSPSNVDSPTVVVTVSSATR